MLSNWSLNKLNIETYNIVLEGDVLKEILVPIQERKKFSYNPQSVIIPRYFYRIIGIEDKEEDYYNFLYELDKQLKNYGRLYLPITEGFNKDISQSMINRLSVVWDKISCFSDVTPDAVVNVVYNSDLLIDFPNETLKNQIKENLIGLMEYYFECCSDEINPEEFKSLLFHIVHWINLYFEQLFMDFDYTNINPKIMFYGEIDIEEVYFLVFLSTLGCDILYFNSLSDTEFDKADRNNIFTIRKEYNRKIYIKPFPTNKIVGRTETTAFKATTDLMKTLHTEDSFCYKPWQFTDYKVSAITLKTTYNEIYIWGKQQAMFRVNWSVEDGTVFIPNIFSKINGTRENLGQYWKEIAQLTELKDTVVYKKLPIGKDTDHISDKVLYNQVLNNKSQIDTQKLINATWWPYGHLRTSLQNIIATKISELCLVPRIKDKTSHNIEETRWKIFSRLLHIEDRFLQVLQQFDYPSYVPKVIVYNNEENGELTLSDCILLTFLNVMGLDIIIYNPSGYNDIENYVEEQYYDIHKLEKMTFNLTYKEKFSFSKLFS